MKDWKTKIYKQIDLIEMDRHQFRMINTCLRHNWFHLLGLFGNEYKLSCSLPNYDIIIKYR